MSDQADAFFDGLTRINRVYIASLKTNDRLRALEAALDIAGQAMVEAKGFIRDMDEGDPSSETGWASDEHLAAWKAIDSALDRMIALITREPK